jgi:hypothetical protein
MHSSTKHRIPTQVVFFLELPPYLSPLWFMMVDAIQKLCLTRRRIKCRQVQRFNTRRKENIVHCLKLALSPCNGVLDFHKIRRYMVLHFLTLMKLCSKHAFSSAYVFCHKYYRSIREAYGCKNLRSLQENFKHVYVIIKGMWYIN